MKEPIDKYFGVPLSEWIGRLPNNLQSDAVGLWHLIPAGRDSFSLDGDALKDFVRRSVIALVERGAVPVRPSAEKDKFWEEQIQYGKFPEEIADNVVIEWQNSGKDPNENGLWFALID